MTLTFDLVTSKFIGVIYWPWLIYLPSTMTVTQKLFKILSGHDVANGRTDGRTGRQTKTPYHNTSQVSLRLYKYGWKKNYDDNGNIMTCRVTVLNEMSPLLKMHVHSFHKFWVMARTRKMVTDRQTYELTVVTSERSLYTQS